MLTPGQSLSHVKILGEISRGGMGIVFRAFDTRLDRETALKVLPPVQGQAIHKCCFGQQIRT